MNTRFVTFDKKRLANNPEPGSATKRLIKYLVM